MCVTFSSPRRGEESWGKSGVLMTAECAAWVMPSASICSTRIKLFTSKTHCLLPDRAVERGGRMMEKRDELNIRKMECLREGEREEWKGGSKDKKRGRCLESKDALLSLERREVGLKECVDLCIYICDFMIMLKTVYSTRLLSLPPMTGSRNVNQEVKIGSEKCRATLKLLRHSKMSSVLQFFYCVTGTSRSRWSLVNY